MTVHLPPFQQLVDAHWRDVARLAHALAGPDDGDDVAQQAWTQALAAYPGLRDARNLRSWLLTVTARCATDVHRARARRADPVAELPDRPAPDRRPADDDGLWQQVRALPDRQRTAVVLRYVGDLDHAGVAAALGTTPAATRRLVSDALATLRAARASAPDHPLRPSHAVGGTR
ncbi:RNA polymerase sigma factor [Angustibacter aerolatus]